MDITPLVPKGRQVITGYGDGGFKINHEWVAGSLIVFADRTIQWNGEITPQSLLPIIETIPPVELLLIGTGKHTAQIDPAIRQLFRSKNIALDIMDTGAACRTYNVLLSEDRRVAAAVIAI